jgi:hypothetical protein
MLKLKKQQMLEQLLISLRAFRIILPNNDLYPNFILFIYCFTVMGIEPKSLYMLGKYSITELHLQPLYPAFVKGIKLFIIILR